MESQQASSRKIGFAPIKRFFGKKPQPEPVIPQINFMNNTKRNNTGVLKRGNQGSRKLILNNKENNKGKNNALQNLDKVINERGIQLNNSEKEIAEAATLAATEAAKEDTLNMVAGIEAINIKKELIRGRRAEAAINFFTTVAQKSQQALPKILTVLAVSGAGATAATGIGLPVAIAAAVTVAAVMRAVNQKMQIRVTLNDHFQRLLYIIKNFAVIQQTLSLLKIDYPVYDNSGIVINSSTGKTEMKYTYVKLSDAFQEALVEYSKLVEAQGSPPQIEGGKIKKMFRKAKLELGKLVSASRVLERLHELFAEIERQYFLEVSKFTTLMFYNEENFKQIKDIIKQSKSYMKLATADLSYKPPNCKTELKPGEEEDDEVCVLPPEALQMELKKDLEMLYSIVTPEDLEKSKDVMALMSEGTEEITQRALQNLNNDLARVDDITRVKVGDVIKAGVFLAEQGIELKGTIEKSVEKIKKIRAGENVGNNNNSQNGGRKRVTHHKKQFRKHRTTRRKK